MLRIKYPFFALMCIFFLLSCNFAVPASESAAESTETSQKLRISNEWIEVWLETANQSVSLRSISKGPAESVYMVLEHYEWFENDSSITTVNVTHFDRRGSVLWQKEVNPSQPWHRSGRFIQTPVSDVNDILYLAGSTRVNSSDEDAVVLRIEPNGSLSWEYLWGKGETDHFHTVTTDYQDNVIAAGATFDPDYPTKAILVKLSPEGEHLWNYTWNESSSAFEIAFYLTAVAKEGEIYALGHKGSLHRDFLVAKFNQLGKMIWNITYRPESEGSWTQSVHVIKCAKRDSGGILILGWMIPYTGSTKIFSVALHDNGSRDEVQFWDTERVMGTDRYVEQWLTDFTNFEENQFLVIGSETETWYDSGTGYQGSLFLLFLDQSGHEITTETWSQLPNPWGERIIRVAPYSYYICGRIANSYERTDEWFMAKFQIEWNDQPKNQDVVVPLIVGSLIVISIIGIALGALGLFRRKYQRK